MKIATFTVSIIFLLALQSTHGAQQGGETANASSTAGADHRQLISMPDEARQLMRKDMLDHLAALNEIIGLIAGNNLEAAADVAETRMGKSSMGKHHATGMGPGRFMPPEMRSIGHAMHASASGLSQAARTGNLEKTYIALAKLTASCVGCHYSYRTR